MAACIYSPLIKNPRRVSDDLISVTDLLPTLAAAAGIKITDSSIDGLNVWDSISKGAPSPRKEMLYNIEQVLGYSAVVNDGWKIVNGSEDINNAVWMGASGSDFLELGLESYAKTIFESESSKFLPELNLETIKSMRERATVSCDNTAIHCNPLKAPCLFNIIEDPCEMNNLAATHPDKLNFMLTRLEHHLRNLVPTRRRFTDDNCDPKFFNGWELPGLEKNLF